MVRPALTDPQQFVLDVAAIPGQVDDLDDPCVPTMERFRREAEAFDFNLAEFWKTVDPADGNDFIDAVEKAMLDYGPSTSLPTEHLRTEGLWMRWCVIDQSHMVTTKVHGTQHPLALMEGVMSVWTPDKGLVTHMAPSILITEPGTRRIIFAHTRVQCVTFHPGADEDVQKLEDRIITPHTNPRLTEAALA